MISWIQRVEVEIKMMSKHRRIFEILLILLAFSLQFEAGAVRIDRIWAIGIPIALILIILFNMNMGRFAIPKIVVLFLVILVYLTILAICWTPFYIGSPLRLKRVAYEFACYLSLFLFFYCAYLTEKNRLGDYLLKWIARSTALVASLSFFTEAFGLMPIRKYLYLLGNIRFGGFLQNPNDFGLMGLVSIVYWVNSDEEPIYYRMPALLSIVFSFFAGRSKGPFAFLMLYFLVYIWNYFSRKSSFFAKKNALYALFFVTAMGAMTILLFLLFKEEIRSIPSFNQNRILNMIIAPGNALNANGSDRMIAWQGALIQIMKSPLIGVGIGGSKAILTYLEYPYPYVTPHSMYLELFAQCGLFLGISVICALFFFAIKLSKRKENNSFILQQAFVLLLWNGLFFGVTWYSVFWILFGILYYRGREKEI